MYRIKIPASSANLGPGFDCLGIALDLYNTFDVEIAETDLLENTEERFNNPDNLFLKAWRMGCDAIGQHDHVHVIFHTDIPSGRGLGTSAALIAGGLYAASLLHDYALSKEDIFHLCAKAEGHPDNAAAAVYGGLCLCMDDGHTVQARQLACAEDWLFTVFIPDFEVHTEDARKVLPEHYSRKDVIWNSVHLHAMIDALESGDLKQLHWAAHDRIHEPYRSRLIPDYDFLKKTVQQDTGGVFLISGSGSTCLLISRQPLSKAAEETIRRNTNAQWTIRQLQKSAGPVIERITL